MHTANHIGRQSPEQQWQGRAHSRPAEGNLLINQGPFLAPHIILAP